MIQRIRVKTEDNSLTDIWNPKGSIQICDWGVIIVEMTVFKDHAQVSGTHVCFGREVIKIEVE
jgi:hypothetical protein